MSHGDPGPSSRLLAYLQLLRIPNVFTALADVSMGFLVVQPSLAAWPVFLLLAGASACLYSAGMVLNDVYDYEIDCRERPHRPLPSGRISVARARTLGYALLVTGVLLAGLAGVVAGDATSLWWRSGVIATMLAACIVLYDAIVKQTWGAPYVMGGCRFFNVLLGMSAGRMAGSIWLGYDVPHLVIAAGIGTYIAGVTWFARTEARPSQRGLLAGGVLLMVLGGVLCGLFPHTAQGSWSFRVEPFTVWPALLCLLMFSVLSRCLIAILDPQPRRVQLAVKQCILSLIFLDAAIVLLVAPAPFAVGVLALYVPTIVLGKWVYST